MLARSARLEPWQGDESMATDIRPDATARVRQFVRGSHRLAITSQSLAELLGLMEAECRIALDAMVASGHLRKLMQGSLPPLYCKE